MVANYFTISDTISKNECVFPALKASYTLSLAPNSLNVCSCNVTESVPVVN